MSIVEMKPRDLQEGPFVIGSVVRLRSGGALMTVRKAGKICVEVDWTDGSDTWARGEFHPQQLCHANPDEEEAK